MRKRRGLGNTGCRIPHNDGDPPIETCGTAKKLTLCIGDRVQRLPIKSGKKTITFQGKGGTVGGVQMGADNRGKKELAARVCFDVDAPGDLAYRFLFSELKKIK